MIEKGVQAAWNVSETWVLRAQLVFGTATGLPRVVVNKEFAYRDHSQHSFRDILLPCSLIASNCSEHLRMRTAAKMATSSYNLRRLGDVCLPRSSGEFGGASVFLLGSATKVCWDGWN